MVPTLLDTDVLSEVLKGKQRQIAQTAEQYIREHQRFTFSAITLYEIERGLLAKQATRLIAQFQAIEQVSTVLPVTVPILRRAARLWADAKAGGQPQNDADLLIAATASVSLRLEQRPVRRTRHGRYVRRGLATVRMVRYFDDALRNRPTAERRLPVAS
jgi:tRNA(fMet)-specific endonuclease VapC